MDRITEFEQQLEEAHTELAMSIKERLVLGGQNAKLVEALKDVIAISDRKHDAWDRAKAILKEIGL
jgi:hypothetical protein